MPCATTFIMEHVIMQHHHQAQAAQQHYQQHMHHRILPVLEEEEEEEERERDGDCGEKEGRGRGGASASQPPRARGGCFSRPGLDIYDPVLLEKMQELHAKKIIEQSRAALFGRPRILAATPPQLRNHQLSQKPTPQFVSQSARPRSLSQSSSSSGSLLLGSGVGGTSGSGMMDDQPPQARSPPMLHKRYRQRGHSLSPDFAPFSSAYHGDNASHVPMHVAAAAAAAAAHSRSHVRALSSSSLPPLSEMSTQSAAVSSMSGLLLGGVGGSGSGSGAGASGGISLVAPVPPSQSASQPSSSGRVDLRQKLLQAHVGQKICEGMSRVLPRNDFEDFEMTDAPPLAFPGAAPASATTASPLSNLQGFKVSPPTPAAAALAQRPPLGTPVASIGGAAGGGQSSRFGFGVGRLQPSVNEVHPNVIHSAAVGGGVAPAAAGMGLMGINLSAPLPPSHSHGTPNNSINASPFGGSSSSSMNSGGFGGGDAHRRPFGGSVQSSSSGGSSSGSGGNMLSFGGNSSSSSSHSSSGGSRGHKRVEPPRVITGGAPKRSLVSSRSPDRDEEERFMMPVGASFNELSLSDDDSPVSGPRRRENGTGAIGGGGGSMCDDMAQQQQHHLQQQQQRHQQNGAREPPISPLGAARDAFGGQQHQQHQHQHQLQQQQHQHQQHLSQSPFGFS